MLQTYLRAALLFQLSSTSWAFSLVYPSIANGKLNSIQNNGLMDLDTRSFNSPPTILFAGSDNNDDFYSDYDPSQYESLNDSSSYDDFGYSQRDQFGSRGGRGGYGRGGRGGRGGGRNFQYSRDTSRDNSNIDEGVIYDLLSQRSEAKRNRDFDTADAIRDDLLQNYAVGIDDRSRTWRTGCSSSGSGMRFGGGGRRGGRGGRRDRDFGPNGHDYEQSENVGPHTSSLSEGEIHALLAERLQAKMSRNFSVADSIQIDLINSGVFVHDGLKEWRADGVPFGDLKGGRGPGRTRGSHSDRNRPYEKSIHSEEVKGCDDSTINKLVMERYKFKIQRNYDKADAIREGLRTKFNIIIDDKLREWSAGGSFGEEHDRQREMAEQFANREYIKSSASLPADNETDEESIQELVSERSLYKADRNYDAADAIRDDLYERFDVIINDKLKEWSIGGAFEGDNEKYRDYVQSPSSSPLAKKDERIVRDALRERSKCKSRRDYESADAIRDELRQNFNVIVDDRKREWRVNVAYNLDEYTESESDVEFDDNFDEEMSKLEAMLSNEISGDSLEGNEVVEEEEEDGIVAEAEDDEEYEYEEEEEDEDGIVAEAEDDEEYEYEYEEEEEDEDGIVAEAEDDAEYEYEYEEEESGIVAEAEDDEEYEYQYEEESGASLSQEELSSLTVVQLKDKLRANGLAVSGKKAELVDRLVAIM